MVQEPGGAVLSHCCVAPKRSCKSFPDGGGEGLSDAEAGSAEPVVSMAAPSAALTLPARGPESAALCALAGTASAGVDATADAGDAGATEADGIAILSVREGYKKCTLNPIARPAASPLASTHHLPRRRRSVPYSESRTAARACFTLT